MQFAVIDIETTGLNAQEARIVEISIIKIFPNGKEGTLSSLINPNIPIPIESTKIHGITDADVQGKPIFKEFAQKVIDFIDGCDLCGFGIMRFDLLVLESEFKRAEIDYSKKERKIVDVLNIYHKVEPRDLSSAYLKYCGKSLGDVHRADIDARATIDILESQLERHNILPRDIFNLHEFCNPKDPLWIDDDGKLRWCNRKAVMNFGKHEGKTLEDISKNEPDYLQWIISKDFSPEVKGIIEEAIKGKFPEQTESKKPCPASQNL